MEFESDTQIVITIGGPDHPDPEHTFHDIVQEVDLLFHDKSYRAESVEVRHVVDRSDLASK